MNIDNLEKWHFEVTEKACNELLNLVLIGKKKATSSSFDAYKLSNEELPKIGDLSVITDWDSNPACVIKTTNIIILPFKDITFDLAKKEGEDTNLESWRKNHITFFKNEGKELGYVFNKDMKVVFEEFEVIEIFNTNKKMKKL